MENITFLQCYVSSSDQTTFTFRSVNRPSTNTIFVSLKKNFMGFGEVQALF